MRKHHVVLTVGALVLALLAVSCAAPPLPSDPTSKRYYSVISDEYDRMILEEVTLGSDDATIRATLTATVLGPVAVCATVGSKDYEAAPATTSSCATVLAVPGATSILTLPLSSPAGTYPFNGTVVMTSSVPALGFVGHIDAVTDVELGCDGVWDDIFVCW